MNNKFKTHKTKEIENAISNTIAAKAGYIAGAFSYLYNHRIHSDIQGYSMDTWFTAGP